MKNILFKVIPFSFFMVLSMFYFHAQSFASESPIEGCIPFTIADAEGHNPPQFKYFPVSQVYRGKPAEINLKSDPEAKTYKSMLTIGAKNSPDFAGKFTFIGWGCGESCLQFAIVSAEDGKVYFAKNITHIWAGHAANLRNEEVKYNAVRYRLDSNLLIVLGAPNEDESREGIAYYKWSDNKLELKINDLRSKLTEY